jgi:hypothetical protein
MSAVLTAAYRIDAASPSAAARLFAIAQRRKSRVEEWSAQTELAQLLRQHLPAGVFVSALENAPRNALAGVKQRGTWPGLPDLLVIWRAGIVFVELKSRRGIASVAQRQFVMSDWRQVSSFGGLPDHRACLVALHRSGVPLTNWKVAAAARVGRSFRKPACAAAAASRVGA